MTESFTKKRVLSSGYATYKSQGTGALAAPILLQARTLRAFGRNSEIGNANFHSLT